MNEPRHAYCPGSRQKPVVGTSYGPGIRRKGDFIRGECAYCGRVYDCRTGVLRAHVDWGKKL